MKVTFRVVDMKTHMLESLNTPGGHIIVFFGLMCTGIAMNKLGLAHADDITFGSFTALLGMLAPKAISTVTSLQNDPAQKTTMDIHSEKVMPPEPETQPGPKQPETDKGPGPQKQTQPVQKPVDAVSTKTVPANIHPNKSI